MVNIDLSSMKNAVGMAAYMSALAAIDRIFGMDTVDETSIRDLHHKMEILSKMDDESKGISYATEESSPCMKTANINKYDQHKSVMFMFAKIHAPFDIIITEYNMMMTYIFSDKDPNPRQSIFSIALTDALVEDDVDIIIPFIEFYIDEFNELDIRKICMEQIRRNYSNTVVGYLIHKGIIDEDARKLKASYEVNKFFETSSDQDWQTKYKSKYCQSKAVEKALAKDYDASMKFIRKQLYYDNPTDPTISVGIGDIISTVIYTAIIENSPDILREFLDNVEDDERFDRDEINETWDDDFEYFWIDAVVPRDDDPTELLNVINAWKTAHGFEMTE